MKKIIIIALLGLFGSMTAFALDGNEILKQVDRNLNPESFEMYRKLINIEPDGTKKEFIMFSVKKGKEKMASIFLSPASEKGRSTLRIGDNMWLYIPNVGKPIRITSLQSVTGEIFNNSDIMRVDYSAEYNCEKIETTDKGYTLYLKAKVKNVAYEAVTMFIDSEKLLPHKIECYAASGMLIKNLYFKNIKDFGDGIIRPAIIETDSPLYKGYKSYIVFAKVKKRDLPSEVFSLNYMQKIDGLRQ
ncbi:MAG: outer membrane lipoprotein-sorting protein [Desulfobacula sp.]|uniref:outer membrane lipoprotein-sorting protein n=1 Tax=Desulfobacula sp. TaxID=2593537 RepID=UPI0025BB17AF|nr:outer membrane lipoprotein-sorting protein [Desulfobacula sp.]MCD4719259.1 outer membrane lipoprotein-sorting protein [Desulfobacula sp.]